MLAELAGLPFAGGVDAVAEEPPRDDDVMKLLMRCGRRVLRLPHRFFLDDVDSFWTALDRSSAQATPTLFPRQPTRPAPLSAFVEGFFIARCCASARPIVPAGGGTGLGLQLIACRRVPPFVTPCFGDWGPGLHAGMLATGLERSWRRESR